GADVKRARLARLEAAADRVAVDADHPVAASSADRTPHARPLAVKVGADDLDAHGPDAGRPRRPPRRPVPLGWCVSGSDAPAFAVDADDGTHEVAVLHLAGAAATEDSGDAEDEPP